MAAKKWKIIFPGFISFRPPYKLYERFKEMKVNGRAKVMTAQLKATQGKTALRVTTVQFISGNRKFFHTGASLRWLTFLA